MIGPKGSVCVYAVPSTVSATATYDERVFLAVDGGGAGGVTGAEALKILSAGTEKTEREAPGQHAHVETVQNLGDGAACASRGPISGTYFITLQVQRGTGGMQVGAYTRTASLTCADVVALGREINSKVGS
jgi:hypothetical protein